MYKLYNKSFFYFIFKYVIKKILNNSHYFLLELNMAKNLMTTPPPIPPPQEVFLLVQMLYQKELPKSLNSFNYRCKQYHILGKKLPKRIKISQV